MEVPRGPLLRYKHPLLPLQPPGLDLLAIWIGFSLYEATVPLPAAPKLSLRDGMGLSLAPHRPARVQRQNHHPSVFLLQVKPAPL